jgi:hypothetical protein
MPRRLILVALLLVATACSDCAAACKAGITFYVSQVTGAMAPGTKEVLTACFDGSCQKVDLSRTTTGPTLFLAFPGVGKPGSHTLSVTGGSSMKGEYRGELPVVRQTTGGGSCATCALAAVQIAADGSLAVGRTLPPGSTAPTNASATTTGG